MFTTSGTYPWSFVTQIFHKGQPSHGGVNLIQKVALAIIGNMIFLEIYAAWLRKIEITLHSTSDCTG